MREAAVVAGLALRELWISFRLLAVIGSLLAAGVAIMLVRLVDPIAAPLPWLAAGVAVAAAFVAGLSAWSFSAERRRGAAAWLVGRSVPRGSVLFGWLLALAAPLVAGLVLVAAFGWLLQGAGSPAAYAAAAGAVLADLFVALATGLLLGTVLAPAPAALVAVLLLAALAAAGGVGIAAGMPLPGDGLRLLAELPARQQPLSDALSAAGTSILVAAVLLGVARLAVERSEL
ncbi:MAG: hypothetical protein ABI534_07025 [Chloroflexota bacterium]